MPAAEPMSQEIINRLKELLAKATPGRLLYCQTYGCAAELVAADTPGDRVIAISPEVVCEDDDQTRIDFEAMQAAWNFVRDNTSTLANLTPSGVERIRAEAFEEAAKLLDRYVTPFGRTGPQPDAVEGQMQKMAGAIRALALPSEPPSQGDVEGRARELADATFATLRPSVIGGGHLHEGEAKYTLRLAFLAALASKEDGRS